MSFQTNTELNILLVEDNLGDARLFETHLQTAPSGSFPAATVEHVDTLERAIESLEANSYDLVLLDLGLPNSSGLDTLDRYTDLMSNAEDVASVPVIVLTGLRDDSAAVEAIERGAQDYLVKDDVDGTILHRTVRYALERHAQQQELRRQNQRLEQFASVVSHDLRNPLSVAKGRIEMVEDDNAEVIKRNLDRMETIIDDVLTLAREGKSVEAVEPVDLAVLLKNCWKNVETDSATLRIEDELSIMADESRCRQLFENLIRNSVEHGSTDDRSMANDSTQNGVEIRFGRVDNGFYFEDNGPGIPADKREQVFEAGYTTNQDGTGFGLNIVREIADAHGWDVRATAGPDGGARFECTGVSFCDSPTE